MTEVITEKPECLEKLKTEEDELLLDIEPPSPIKRGKGRPRKIIEEVDPDAQPKPKRVMSEKQKQILENARKVRMENFEKRQDARKIIAEEKKLEKEQREKEIERKILKKAVCIKKKQIVEEAILNDDLDDDIPNEIVEKIVKKQRAKKVTTTVFQAVEPVEPKPIKSKYTFV